LQFLIGEFSGLETLYPPESSPVQFLAFLTGQWETCDRFIKLDFYAEIPKFGIESFHGLITYSESRETYRMWLFAASQEEPLHMMGDFEDEETIRFVGDPTPMTWGMQRLRFTFRPLQEGGYELLGERWEPDGYAKYCSVTYREEI